MYFQIQDITMTYGLYLFEYTDEVYFFMKNRNYLMLSNCRAKVSIASSTWGSLGGSNY